MANLSELPSIDSGIDIQVAELSVTGVLRFAQWSQGSGELEPALDCVMELFGADRCALIRIDPDQMKSELICAVSSNSAVRPSGGVGNFEAFASRILGSDVRRHSEGNVRFLSRMSQLPFRLRGGVDQELSLYGIEDIAFICIETSKRGVVLLEVQYQVRPTRTGRQIVDWIVPKLLRAYRPGKGRRIDEDLAAIEEETRQRQSDATNPSGPHILEADNPNGLTRCEWKVCELASRGLSAKSIAYELGVTGNTVRTHLRNIYAKTEVAGYHELVYALVSQARHDFRAHRRFAT